MRWSFGNFKGKNHITVFNKIKDPKIILGKKKTHQKVCFDLSNFNVFYYLSKSERSSQTLEIIVLILLYEIFLNFSRLWFKFEAKLIRG